MLRVGVIGRTAMLLDSAKLLAKQGFEIPFVYTCDPESFYRCAAVEFEDFADSIGADFFSDTKINSEPVVKKIKTYDCDVAISVNWLTVLREAVCKVFKHGIWNAHVGDLPRYRGNACPNWAILNGEKTIGLSIHEMMPDFLDQGDIILKEHMSLTSQTYISDIYEWMQNQVPQLFIKGLTDLSRGALVKQKQSDTHEAILRCYPRKPEDSRISWGQNVELIMRLIRASSHPFSGAFCYFKDNVKVRVWKAIPIEHHGQFCAVPGQVLYACEDDPVIACHDGILRLTDVTFDTNHQNAKPMILKSLRNRLI